MHQAATLWRWGGSVVREERRVSASLVLQDQPRTQMSHARPQHAARRSRFNDAIQLSTGCRLHTLFCVVHRLCSKKEERALTNTSTTSQRCARRSAEG